MTNIGELVDYELPKYIGFHEYIHSYLVEHPGSYYLLANRTEIYYLDRRYGLLQFGGDYKGLTHEEICEYILGALELVTQAIEEEGNKDDGSDFPGHGDDGAQPGAE